MADSPTTTNKAATIENDVLHALIFDVAVTAAETEIVAAVPALGLPIIKQVQTSFVKFVAGKIYAALAKGATFAIIDAQTSAEAAAANQAADKLKQAIAGNGNLKDATNEFSQAFGRLVRYDGSAPIHP